VVTLVETIELWLQVFEGIVSMPFVIPGMTVGGFLILLFMLSLVGVLIKNIGGSEK
jgi:hypothetical protein